MAALAAEVHVVAVDSQGDGSGADNNFQADDEVAEVDRLTSCAVDAVAAVHPGEYSSAVDPIVGAAHAMDAWAVVDSNGNDGVAVDMAY